MYANQRTLLYPSYKEQTGRTGQTISLSTLSTLVLFQIYAKHGASLTRFWFTIRSFTGDKSLASCKVELFELVGNVPSGSALDSVTIPVGGFSSLPSTSQYFFVDFTGSVVLDNTKYYGVVVSSLVEGNYPTLQNSGALFAGELGWGIGHKVSTNGGSSWSTYFSGTAGYIAEYSDGFHFGQGSLDGYHQSSSTYGSGFEINALDFDMDILGVQLISNNNVIGGTCKIWKNRNLVAESLPTRIYQNAVCSFEKPIKIEAGSRVAVTATAGIGFELIFKDDIVYIPPLKALPGYELNGRQVNVSSGGVLSVSLPSYLYVPSFSLILAYSQKSSINRRQFFNAR